MSKGNTIVIHVPINGGWLSGRHSHQIDRRVSLFLKKVAQERGIVQIIPDQRNFIVQIMFFCIACLTLGFFAPHEGYTVVLEEVKTK